MQGVITREDINPVIKFTDYSPYAEGIDKESYTYNDLNKEIDAFKNLLQSKSKKKKKKKIPTVVIGMQASKEQFACLFACYELGILSHQL